MMTIAELIVLLIQLGIGGAILTFWGWIAVKTIENGREIVELRARLDAQDKNCERHQVWAEDFGKEQKEQGKNIARLCGLLEARV